MSHKFYAKQDGELALAGNKNDELSPTTSNFLVFMYANPGAGYPSVLSEFQYMVLNRCEQVSQTNRNVIFVFPRKKTWTNDEIIHGLGA
jgi:hypothetical protein